VRCVARKVQSPMLHRLTDEGAERDDPLLEDGTGLEFEPLSAHACLQCWDVPSSMGSGEEGASHALQILTAEVDTTRALIAAVQRPPVLIASSFNNAEPHTAALASKQARGWRRAGAMR